MARLSFAGSRHARACWPAVLLCAAGPLFATENRSPEQDSTIAGPASRSWGAAVGFVASIGPEYAGGSRQVSTLEPGLALRWGPVSLASRSAFAVRRTDPGASAGLRVDLARSERFSAGVSLRYDGGRKESSAERLRGLGDVPRTLRVRVSASWRLDERWRLGSALLVDALGRGTGTALDLRLSRDLRWTDNTTWGASLAVLAGDRRFLQSSFGVTPEQASRSGYAVFEPSAGLLDLKLGLNGRTELTPHWAAFYGATAFRLLGEAARSPLTLERNGLSVSAGLVYRF